MSAAVGSTTNGPGRPRGIDPETMFQGRMVHEAVTILGHSIKELSDKYGVSENTLYRNSKLYREMLNPGAAVGTVKPPAPPKPRKLSLSTIAMRAVTLRRLDLVRGFALHLRYFLEDAVLAIREYAPDGIELWFGRGLSFESYEHFAHTYGGQVADLQKLIDRGLLVDLDGRGIAMPDQYGLRPKVKPARDSASEPTASPEPHHPSKGPPRGQGFILHGLPGGRGSTDAAGGSVGSGGISSESEGGISLESRGIFSESFGGISSESGGISSESSGLAQAVVVVVEEKEIQPLNNNNNHLYPARAGENDSNNIPSDSNEIPPKNSNNIPSDSEEMPPDPLQTDPALTDMARRLLALAKTHTEPKPVDLVHLAGWLKAGLTEAQIGAMIGETMSKPGATPKKLLSYFAAQVKNELARASAARSRPSYAQPAAQPGLEQPAAPALTPEQEEFRRRLTAAWEVRKRDSRAPFPGRAELFWEHPVLAGEWLTLFEAYTARDFRGEKPPDFGVFVKQRSH